MRLSFLIALSASLASFSTAGARTWFVRWDATGSNEGTSWADAFADLQDALSVAQPADEVWIAAGTYRPDRGTGNRLMAFLLPCGVRYYGGFAGWEGCPEERDLSNNATILSGDLSGDDNPVDCRAFSNCCTEHDGLGCDDTLCQQIVCSSDNFSLQECCPDGTPWGHTYKWTDYCADYARIVCCELGGWNACENSIVVAELSACEQLTELDGITVANGYFASDRDYPLANFGAGLFVEGSMATISNCAFRGTVSQAVFIIDSPIDFDDCKFVNNSAGVYGSGDVSFANCAFRQNRTSASVTGSARYKRCSFIDNENAGLYVNGPFSGGGHSFIESCVIAGNGLRGIEIRRTTVTLTDSVISDNNVGGVVVGDGALIAHNSRFSRNRNQPALSMGNSTGLIENCLFDNGTHQGFNSVADISNGAVEFRNSTFAHNLGRDRPARINTTSIFAPAPVTLTNCLFWVGDEYDVAPDDLLKAFFSGASFSVNHSIIQGWSGAMGGVGNSGVSPQFVDPDGLDDIPGNDDDDFRLAPGSAGINAGNPNFVAESGETDLDGHARVLCGAVDIGAYEFGIGDFNCDQSIDLLDQATWNDCMTNPRPSAVRPGCEAFDFNADFDIDLSDFAAQQRILISP